MLAMRDHKVQKGKTAESIRQGDIIFPGYVVYIILFSEIRGKLYKHQGDIY